VIELIRTNDVVLLSALKAELTAHAVDFLELDSHTSVAEGSLGVLPRRLMVPEGQAAKARWLLQRFTEDHV